MRLAWIVANAHPAVASFRYRCLIPAWGMHQIGHDSAIFVDEQPDPADFDAMIIVKQAGDRGALVPRPGQGGLPRPL
jgi:hypothetical protein